MKSMVNFMRDPTGDIPWEEDAAAQDITHVETPAELNRLLQKEKSPLLIMFYAPCKCIQVTELFFSVTGNTFVIFFKCSGLCFSANMMFCNKVISEAKRLRSPKFFVGHFLICQSFNM